MHLARPARDKTVGLGLRRARLLSSHDYWHRILVRIVGVSAATAAWQCGRPFGSWESRSRW